jgi:hypothetical protein
MQEHLTHCFPVRIVLALERALPAISVFRGEYGLSLIQIGLFSWVKKHMYLS